MEQKQSLYSHYFIWKISTNLSKWKKLKLCSTTCWIKFVQTKSQIRRQLYQYKIPMNTTWINYFLHQWKRLLFHFELEPVQVHPILTTTRGEESMDMNITMNGKWIIVEMMMVDIVGVWSVHTLHTLHSYYQT